MWAMRAQGRTSMLPPHCHTWCKQTDRETEQRRDSSTPITMRDSLLHLVSSHDPSFFSAVAPLQLLPEDRFSWGRGVERRRRHSPARSLLLFPSPALQPGVEGIVLAEKINVRVSRSGSLGPRRLKASEAASYITKAYSNLEADPSKNAPKFRTLDCFGAVDVDVCLILKFNSSSNSPYVSGYLSIFVDIAGINVKTSLLYKVTRLGGQESECRHLNGILTKWMSSRNQSRCVLLSITRGDLTSTVCRGRWENTGMHWS